MTIYKEAGYTSSDVVARLRGILHMKKIGHTGTLDPDAEGVLPVCLGKGTKLCELIADRDKEYVAVLRLGTVTDTQDMSGTVLRSVPDDEVIKSVTPEKLEEAASKFRGKIRQVPPMYSAVKIGGKRLYELARQGRTVERPAREVTIYELEITEVALPLVTMRVRCSKGTYIRTLCQDLGEELGTGGAMESLLRTRVGRFTLEEAIRLDDAEAIMKSDDPDRILEHIMPIDSFFEEAPKANVRPEGMKALLNGNSMRRNLTDLPAMKKRCEVRMYGQDGRFCALYRYDPVKDELRNVKMFTGGEN